MKKTVKTREGHTINFIIESSDGTPAGADTLERLADSLISRMLTKAEPGDNVLIVPITHCA